MTNLCVRYLSVASTERERYGAIPFGLPQFALQMNVKYLANVRSSWAAIGGGIFFGMGVCSNEDHVKSRKRRLSDRAASRFRN